MQNNTGADITFTPAVGWLILEAKPATLVVTQGIVTTPASAASWATTINATEGGITATTPTVTTNAKSGQLAVTKFVRNTAGGVGVTSIIAPALLGGATYYQTGVTGNPGQTLEYLLVINNPGTGNATSVIATDPVPTYTTLVSSSAAYGANNGGALTGTFAQALRGGVVQTFKVDNTVGIGTVGWGKAASLTGLMTFNLGNGSTSTVGGGGAVNSLETDYIIYQVTIN